MIPSVNHFLTGTKTGGGVAGVIGNLVKTLADSVMTAVGNLTTISYTGGGVIDFDPVLAVCGVSFESDGSVIKTPASTGNYSGDPAWIEGTFDPADYEIKADLVSEVGNSASGNISFSVYQPLSISRYLEVSQPAIGASLSIINITIREIAVPANSTTGQINLSAEAGT